MFWGWGDIFALARVTGSRISGVARAVLVNVERRALAGDVDDSADEPSFGPLGVYGRPDEPSGTDGAEACEVLCTRVADGMRPIVYRDLRISRRVNPKVGDIGIAHYGGGYLSLGWDADRTATIVTLSGTHLSSDEVDESHFLQLDPTDAGNSVTLAHRSGSYVALTKSGAVTLTSADGNGTITVQDSTGDDGAQPNVVIGGSLALVGGIIAGSTNAARSVALAQEVIDLATELLSIVTALAAIPPLTAALNPHVPVLTARLAALIATGSSQTLKASPT